MAINYKKKKQTQGKIFEILRDTGSISVNKALSHAIGLEAAAVYSEVAYKGHYWKDNLTDDGFFFCTYEDMMINTSLSEHKIRKAIEILENLDLIRTALRGLPARKHYKLIDDDAQLWSLIEQGTYIMENFKEAKKFKKGEVVKRLREEQERANE